MLRLLILCVTLFQWEPGKIVEVYLPVFRMQEFITRKPPRWNRKNWKMRGCKTGYPWARTTLRIFSQCCLFGLHSAVVADLDPQHKRPPLTHEYQKVESIVHIPCGIVAPGEGSVWLGHAVNAQTAAFQLCRVNYSFGLCLYVQTDTAKVKHFREICRIHLSAPFCVWSTGTFSYCIV